MKIKPPPMKRVMILVPALLILLCAFFSGCTSDAGTPAPATTAPTPSPTTAPVIITMTPTPLPTTERIRIVPAERQVNLVLTKDRPTSEIHLLYQGGPGELYTNRVMMRVYTSETEYKEYIMSGGKKPLPGDEIIAPGTRSGDRCEVFIISAGTRYKVMDEPVFGGMYY
jgi:hypothetical protein